MLYINKKEFLNGKGDLKLFPFKNSFYFQKIKTEKIIVWFSFFLELP